MMYSVQLGKRCYGIGIDTKRRRVSEFCKILYSAYTGGEMYHLMPVNHYAIMFWKE